MKTRLFLFHSNQIGQPISSSREFSEDHKLHSESMCFICMSTANGNAAVQNKRRILYVPRKAGLKTAARLCLSVAKHLDENWGKKNANYLGVGKHALVIIEMPRFLARCCSYFLITGIKFLKRGDEHGK